MQTYQVEKRSVNPNSHDERGREITLSDDAFIVKAIERAPHKLLLYVAVPTETSDSRSADADADAAEQCVYVKDNGERCQNDAQADSETCWVDSHDVA